MCCSNCPRDATIATATLKPSSRFREAKWLAGCSNFQRRVRPRRCHRLKSLCRLTRAARRSPKIQIATLTAKQIIAAVQNGIVLGRCSLSKPRNSKTCEATKRTPAAMFMVFDVMACSSGLIGNGRGHLQSILWHAGASRNSSFSGSAYGLSSVGMALLLALVPAVRCGRWV